MNEGETVTEDITTPVISDNLDDFQKRWEARVCGISPLPLPSDLPWEKQATRLLRCCISSLVA